MARLVLQQITRLTNPANAFTMGGAVRAASEGAEQPTLASITASLFKGVAIIPGSPVTSNTLARLNLGGTADMAE